MDRKNSKDSFDVFLGGACNPTTWRTNVAIPYLKKHNVSFFNPQCDKWHPELIEIERNAKENSSVLLFVFEPTESRGVASLVESSYLAGLQKNLIIVMPDLHKKLERDSFMCDLDPVELDELCVAYETLRKLSLYTGIRVFSDLQEALNFASEEVTNLKMKRKGNLSEVQEKIQNVKQRSENLSNIIDDILQKSSSDQLSKTTVKNVSVDAKIFCTPDGLIKECLSLRESLLCSKDRLSNEHSHFCVSLLGCLQQSSNDNVSSRSTSENSSTLKSNKQKSSYHHVYIGGASSMPPHQLTYLIHTLESRGYTYVLGSSPTQNGQVDENVFDVSVVFYYIPQSAINLDLQLEVAYLIGVGLPCVLCTDVPALHGCWRVEERVSEHSHLIEKCERPRNLQDPSLPITTTTNTYFALRQSPFSAAGAQFISSSNCPNSLTSNPTTPAGLCTTPSSITSSGLGESPGPLSFSPPAHQNTMLLDSSPFSTSVKVPHSTSDEGIALEASPCRKIPRASGPVLPQEVQILSRTSVPLSSTACEDFVRGRMYLRDLALNTHNCVVWMNLESALACCLDLISRSKKDGLFSIAPMSAG